MIPALAALLDGRRIVALTGAGLSTESGIPDYRSPQALAKPRRPIHGPEFIRSESVRKRYWARAALGWPRFRAAEPNRGHSALASLERAGRVVRVITQNVDRLHAKAGSRAVTELHGALFEVACLACGAIEDRGALQDRIARSNPGWSFADAPLAPDGDAELAIERIEGFVVPSCVRCAGVLKPRVVFFGDNVPKATVEQAYAAVDAAEALLVVGTSLHVFSGYRFLRRAVERGIPIAIVNRGPVRGEEHAALKIEGGTGEVLSALAAALLEG